MIFCAFGCRNSLSRYYSIDESNLPRDIVVARPNGTANQVIPPARKPHTPKENQLKEARGRRFGLTKLVLIL